MLPKPFNGWIIFWFLGLNHYKKSWLKIETKNWIFFFSLFKSSVNSKSIFSFLLLFSKDFRKIFSFFNIFLTVFNKWKQFWYLKPLLWRAQSCVIFCLFFYQFIIFSEHLIYCLKTKYKILVFIQSFKILHEFNLKAKCH